MCQVNNFNTDHERNVKACNCCKNKESAAAISATLAERERILEILAKIEAVGWDYELKDYVLPNAIIALIKGEK